MRQLTYAMNVTLDGYIADRDAGLGWGSPDSQVLQFWIERTRTLSAYVMGRHLYEAMLYWESAAHDAKLGAHEREWARVWLALPKVVFSSSLTEVQGNARLAMGSLTQEVERLRSDSARGDIAIGGATLAAAAADLGLIDAYQPIVHPVLVGGGVPFFPRSRHRVPLELVETRQIGSDVVSLRYRTHNPGETLHR